MSRRRSLAFLIAAASVVGACYSPNIAPGGFRCSTTSGCPAGFHCFANGRCYTTDAGVDLAPVCTSVTSLPHTCEVLQTSGSCNPGCQSGCDDCGWCAIVNGSSTCLKGTAGTKGVGAACDPTQTSDCQAGLYCQPECAGGTIGRCYQLCEKSVANSCKAGTCTQNARTVGGTLLPAYSLCSLVPPSCDPIGQMGCPTGYACYPAGTNLTGSECDCAGSSPTGGGCTFNSDCKPGDQCVTIGSNSCYVTCTLAGGCATGTCNANPTVQGMFGYCN